MSCIGCKYYDDTVDCCNADDLCPMEEYYKGRKSYKDELTEQIKKLWNKYESDKKNVPKPDVLSVIALMECIDDTEYANN